jgi:hypothetical protein
MDKRSSLFWCSVNDDDKKCLITSTPDGVAQRQPDDDHVSDVVDEEVETTLSKTNLCNVSLQIQVLKGGVAKTRFLSLKPPNYESIIIEVWVRSSQASTFLSGLPDRLVTHGRGLGHPGEVEHQVDVVVLVRLKVRGGESDDDKRCQNTQHLEVITLSIAVLLLC